MLNRIVWQGSVPHAIGIVDNGMQRQISVTPIVTVRDKKITVGLSHSTATTTGLWLSSGHCDFMQAWRTAQLLGEILVLKDYPSGATSIDKLLQAVKGNRGATLMRYCAVDLGLTLEAVIARLKELQETTPTDQVVTEALENLPSSERKELAREMLSREQDTLDIQLLIHCVNALGPAGVKHATNSEASVPLQQRPATLRDICGPEAAVKAQERQDKIRRAVSKGRAAQRTDRFRR